MSRGTLKIDALVQSFEDLMENYPEVLEEIRKVSIPVSDEFACYSPYVCGESNSARYRMSVLGFLNGLLESSGYVLAEKQTEDDELIGYTKIKRAKVISN